MKSKDIRRGTYTKLSEFGKLLKIDNQYYISEQKQVDKNSIIKQHIDHKL